MKKPKSCLVWGIYDNRTGTLLGVRESRYHARLSRRSGCSVHRVRVTALGRENGR